MIYVCDAIMGSGKSSAAINHMNANPEEHFIYVTPFIDEAKRIKDACPALHFWCPTNTLEEYEHQKRLHFKHLVSCGMNIATTHSLFSLCDAEAIQMIEDQEYTIIIDEAISVMDKINGHADDVSMAMSSRWFQCMGDVDDGNVHEICVTEEEYAGSWMRDIKLYASSHRLVALRDADGNDRLYCWMFNSDLFYAAKTTYVLTYLFEASPMCYLLQMKNIEYQKIGVIKDPETGYQFADAGLYMPEYARRLDQMIHILDNKRMNAVGERYNALSISWSQNASKSPGKGNAAQLKKNLQNYFSNIHRDSTPEDRLWTCHSKLIPILKAKGYMSRHIAFNSRATNDFRRTTVLAYCANVFMPVWEKRYYEQQGVTVDDNAYALSTLVQWIWRSAIRDGQEIWIYIPSKRMRNLLKQWIDEVTKEGISLNKSA